MRSYECGPDGSATLATICNYLQEAASLHAEELGFSRSNFAAAGQDISWVLTRMHVKMIRYPRWEEKVAVETFPRAGRRIVTYRDFALRIGEETIGVATSEWMIIDLATRKVVAIPPEVFEHSERDRTPVMGTEAFAKLHWPGAAAANGCSFRARRGDIDLNGHVNNVHYIEWLVEALPADAGCIADFEIAFKSETLSGESVRAEASETEPGVWMAHVAGSDGRDHVVARLGMEK